MYIVENSSFLSGMTFVIISLYFLAVLNSISFLLEVQINFIFEKKKKMGQILYSNI